MSAPLTHLHLGYQPDQAGSAAHFLRFCLGFWTGGSGRQAWRFAAAILALLGLNLLVSIGLNSWHRWFFDMLERRDAASLPAALLVLLALILVGAACTVAMVKCSMTLQLNWRCWVTDELIRIWSGDDAENARNAQINDQGSTGYRIVQDVRLALDPLVDMTIGFINALAQGLTFFAVLIVVGGSIRVSMGAWDFTVPAYLAIAALSYALLMSALMHFVGSPLVRSVAEKNEAESRFLFEMTKLSSGGPRRADRVLHQEAFSGVRAGFKLAVQRWLRVIRAIGRLTWLTNSNSYFTPALPLILAAPKYIHGQLTLGSVIQIAAAFTIVLGVLNWFTDNYVRLAEWSASAQRVDELKNDLAKRDATHARCPRSEA